MPGRGNYTDILPSFTALLHFTPKLQLRLSYTTNVHRPSFYDTRPFFFAETRATPKIIFAGNPALEAQRERSEEHTSELQSLMRNSYAVFCLTKKNETKNK